MDMATLHAQRLIFGDLTGTGIVTKQLNNDTKDNWTVAGGRGSGVPIIAGLIRPEEVELAASSAGDGKIHHALAFSLTRTVVVHPCIRLPTEMTAYML